MTNDNLDIGEYYKDSDGLIFRLTGYTEQPDSAGIVVEYDDFISINKINTDIKLPNQRRIRIVNYSYFSELQRIPLFKIKEKKLLATRYMVNDMISNPDLPFTVTLNLNYNKNIKDFLKTLNEILTVNTKN